MAEKTVSILRAIGNPNKAKIIAHLAKHRGETAENIGKHLGYPLPTVYKYLRELEAASAIESEAKGRLLIKMMQSKLDVIFPCFCICF